jgi:hypothetical protein
MTQSIVLKQEDRQLGVHFCLEFDTNTKSPDIKAARINFMFYRLVYFLRFYNVDVQCVDRDSTSIT